MHTLSIRQQLWERDSSFVRQLGQLATAVADLLALLGLARDPQVLCITNN